ncbi:hypothetical protein TUM17561_28400 [Enterobacter cloacae]|jgi:hypothetical protein|nr:hypothetical protein TUM17561_28400 [Enterobacter cloacae]
MITSYCPRETNVCSYPQLISGEDGAENSLIQPATLKNSVQAVWINVRNLKNHHFQGNSLKHQ